MEAIALGKDEDPVEADKIISSFISLVHLELMDTDQLINFNMKNNLEQSVAWSVDCLHSFKTLGTNSATFWFGNSTKLDRLALVTLSKVRIG